jgi:hypothetical protein
VAPDATLIGDVIKVVIKSKMFMMALHARLHLELLWKHASRIVIRPRVAFLAFVIVLEYGGCIVAKGSGLDGCIVRMALLATGIVPSMMGFGQLPGAHLFFTKSAEHPYTVSDTQSKSG